MTTRPLAPAQLAPAIRQKAILAFSLLALCTLGLSLPASAQKSAFTTFDPPGPIVETIPTSMSPSGAITGWYFDGNIFHGFLRSRQGAFTILDFPGATGTSGASINPAGTITGYYFDGSGLPVFHGFVRSPDGDWTSFDPVGATDTEPASINPAGEIAGTYYDANHVSHGFLRDPDGAITGFDVPDSNGGTFVTGMSPSGEITGYYDDNDEYPQPQRGFLRSRDGAYTTFVPPPGEGCSSCRVNVLSTMPWSINPAGEIIGNFYRDDSQTVHGFVRERDGKITILDAPCAGASTFPNSINAAGVITGIYYGCGAAHGFVRDRDDKITTFDPPGSTYTMPTSINDAGAITGWYVDASSVTHGFLRSPAAKSRGGQQH
jgi:hypothetical protein